MRFIISAVLLALATSAIATTSPDSSFTSPRGGDKLKCRRINKVEWKKFEWEKKIVWLVVKDRLNKVIASQQVEPRKGSADVFIPEFFDRTAKLVIIDDKNTLLFESGEEISIDCHKKKDHDGEWNRDGMRDGEWNNGENDLTSEDASSEDQ